MTERRVEDWLQQVERIKIVKSEKASAAASSSGTEPHPKCPSMRIREQ